MRSPLIFAVLLALGANSAASAERPKGVVELFTSQGCSSCPPADRLMGELARDPELIVLSMPVDYWDYMGWKDTLARPECTARQKGYAASRGDGQVYTPQAVVDGVTHVIGSERSELMAALAAHRSGLVVDVAAHVSDNRIVVEVGAGAPQPANVWLVEIAPQATVAIGRGENAGRTFTYTNVARGMTRLGEWNGAAARFDTSLAVTPGDGFVVLVQAGTQEHPGAILGATKGPPIAPLRAETQ
jgi:hypothetical protein